MFGRGKRGEGPGAAAPVRPEVIAEFPRGLPDGDLQKPGATGRWPSADEIAGKVASWRPDLLLLGRDHEGRYFGHSDVGGRNDDRHMLTVAGSRSGKGVSLICPALLYWPGSVIAIDPKGELATLTASRRSAHGSIWSAAMDPGEGRVYVLDPYERVSGPAEQYRSCFNPLADLDPDTDRGVDMAWQIADGLIVQSKGDGAHWTQSARSFLRGLILFVAKSEPPASRNLVRVRELITQDADELAAMLEKMKASGGLIGQTGSSMSSKPVNERYSILSTCETHTAFIAGEAMRRVLSGSDFRMEDLKAGRVTIYLCLPATRLATHERWLRMLVSLALEAMERTGPMPRDKPSVLFCLDEFAALGHMESIEKAAGQIASFGVKLWPIIQDLTQLQRDYKEAWETFMGNAGLLTFFGNTDLTTTEHMSKRLGETEYVRTVFNYAENWQKQQGQSRPDLLAALSGMAGGQINDGGTLSGGQTASQSMNRGPLMNPSELSSFFARDAGNILCFIARRDLPPFALYRCAYHSEEDDGIFGGLYDPLPGLPNPRTTAAERIERDTAETWRVPVVR